MKARLGGLAELFLCVTLAAACGAKKAPATPTADGRPLPHASSTTSTTIDVAAVPATIDKAYAQAVIDALDKAMGDAIRVFVRDKGPSTEFEARIRAIHNGPGADAEVESWQRMAAQEMDNIRPDAGAPRTSVRDLLGATQTCIYFTATRDFSSVFVSNQAAGGTPYVELFRKQPIPDKYSANRTAWAIVADRTVNGDAPANPCGARR